MRKVHKLSNWIYSLCGVVANRATTGNKKVTCKRCLKIMEGKK